jgi:hypothetical protein
VPEREVDRERRYTAGQRRRAEVGAAGMSTFVQGFGEGAVYECEHIEARLEDHPEWSVNWDEWEDGEGFVITNIETGRVAGVGHSLLAALDDAAAPQEPDDGH